MPGPRKRIVGIVGSEAAKFTTETERRAREEIRKILVRASAVVSGACHLGGIDVWAVEEAKEAGLPTVEHPPKVLSWGNGYKPRNLRIVDDSDEVVCITVSSLPSGFAGLVHGFCYHCGNDAPNHVKSGGCWTMKQATLRGKKGTLVVI